MSKYREPMYERIRRIRLLRRKYLKDTTCSEDRFSTLLGIKTGILKKIEAGEKEPSADTLSKASKILKVSVEHLFENKVMAEDELTEPITFTVQIGSVIHAARTKMINKSGKSDWRQHSLKSVAKKLGISSMELNRIEGLNRSKHFEDDRFMKKVASLFSLSPTYIKDLVDSSFPRGEKKKLATLLSSNTVHYVRDGNKVRGLVVLNDSFSRSDIDALKKRIEFEVELLCSKPAKQ